MHNLSKDSFGRQMMQFYDALQAPELPSDILPLLPFKEESVRLFMKQFYHQYFSDSNPRVLLFGINPGRLGAGVTGIGFTDPIRLQEVCGITHNLDLKPEPSSVFVYNMIEAFGGPEHFYRHFHFTSVSPVGYVSNGVNVNYYETTELRNATEAFIVESIKKQIHMPVNRKVAFSVGKDKTINFSPDSIMSLDFSKGLNRYHIPGG
jgi:hypothetical protein